jgi:membrane-associated phospholipid phosphatase
MYAHTVEQDNNKGEAVVKDVATSSWGILEKLFPNYLSWSRPRTALFLLCIYLLTAATPYILTNQIAAWRDVSLFNPENFIDDMIPYMPWTIVFYFSFYLYFPIVAWYGSGEGERRLEGFMFHIYLTLSTWLACVLFIATPVKVNLRHQVTFADGLFDPFLASLHDADPPFNSWPSLHVFQSLLIILVMRRWMLKDKKWTKIHSIIVGICWSLLVLSTMGIKQHYMFDAVTGIMFAIGAWYFCVRRLNQAKRPLLEGL